MLRDALQPALGSASGQPDTALACAAAGLLGAMCQDVPSCKLAVTEVGIVPTVMQWLRAAPPGSRLQHTMLSMLAHFAMSSGAAVRAAIRAVPGLADGVVKAMIGIMKVRVDSRRLPA